MKTIFIISIMIFFLQIFGFAQSPKAIADTILKNMVLIEGGTFEMGSITGGDDEKPVHIVRVDNFYMCKFEVRVKEWKQLMGSNPSYFVGCDDCPVETVSWNEIQIFIKKLNELSGKNFRLPTEAEWEYAAKAGKHISYNDFSGNKEIGAVGWFRDNSDAAPHKVGLKSPNANGIYDMTGNVWEWCSDWYQVDYYAVTPRENPQGPQTGEKKVLRGGSWNNFVKHSKVTYRDTFESDFKTYDYGFRLCYSKE